MGLTDKLNGILPKLQGSSAAFNECVNALFGEAKNDKERAIITEFIESTLSESADKLKEEFELLQIKSKLLEVDEILPYSYIAKEYFNKSRGWLSQRVRGNKVNGKTAKFTSDEIKTLNFAIQDISKKFGSITLL